MKTLAVAMAALCAYGAVAGDFHARRPWPSPEERRSARPEGEGERGAIRRGLAYLRSHRSDPSALAVLDYLQRKYALEDSFAFGALWTGPDEALRGWGRVVGRDVGRQITAGPLSPDTEQLVERALDCDRTPLPADFPAVLARYVAEGRFEGYEVTHAALVLKLLDDRRCPVDLEAVRRAVAERAVALVAHRERPQRDVLYEALAVLQDFVGRRDIDGAVFARLLGEQRADGGWPTLAGAASAPHPTALAVWSLLARAHPDAADVPFARR